jgi:hypothetical protein
LVVSPLSKYYVSLLGYLGSAITIFLAATLGLGLGPVTALVVMAAFTMIFASFINGKHGIRCPNCGVALGFMRTFPSLAGLPGRHCTHCRADLTIRTPSSGEDQNG